MITNVYFRLIALTIILNVFSLHSQTAPAPYPPLPNERQLKYMQAPMAAFIHYGMNTYTGVEWGTGRESASSFNPPQEVNTDQWASVLKECGFDRVILTGKHHDGFCLWPSKANATKPHTIAQSPYKNGNGDLFEQLSESCTKYGLDMGVYLSPWDAYEENVGGHYTNALYNDFYDVQLREVLGKYGRLNEKSGKRELVEVWLDGATGSSNPPTYDFVRFCNTMRELQPDMFIWMAPVSCIGYYGQDVCQVDGGWAGNENGQAPETCWNKISVTPSAANKHVEEGQFFHLLEADVSIRSGWFYGNGGGLKTAVDLFKERYMKSIGRGIPLILNIPPDRNGVFAEQYVAVLKKYKEYIDTTFGTNIMPKNATATASSVRANSDMFSADKLLDNDPDTYWTMDDGSTTGSVEVDFGIKKRFDIIEFGEYIQLGQRIKGWNIDVKVDGTWSRFASGTTIGYKRLVQNKQVEATGVRLTITNSLAVPLINSLKIYQSHPDLTESDLPPVAGQDGEFEMESEYTVANETDLSVTVKVLLKNGGDNQVSVYAATTPGTGVQGKTYQDKSEVITFAPGETEKEFTVNLLNNSDKGDLDFYVELFDNSGDTSIGSLQKSCIVVYDDDETRSERTISVSSSNDTYGNVEFIVPTGIEGNSVTTSHNVRVRANAVGGGVFLNWTVNGTEVSTNATYEYSLPEAALLTANFELPPYCSAATSKSRSDRYVSSFTIGDNNGNSLSISDMQSASSSAQPVYWDKTSSVITVYPGATIAFTSMTMAMNAMHGLLFIDYNKDHSFDMTANPAGTNNGEAVSFTNINGLNSAGASGTNINGASSMPSFVLKTDLAAGDYRARFDIDYNPADACGKATQGTNGGIMVDFIIRVIAPSATHTITLEANPSEGGNVVGGGTSTGAITCTATANKGYVFVSWTDKSNGEIISTSAVYTDVSDKDRTLVANFGLIPERVLPEKTAPATSSATDPTWFLIRHKKWNDGNRRDYRFVSHNGSAPVSIDSTLANLSFSDETLWRFDGTDISAANIVSKDGKQLLLSGAGSKTDMTVVSSNGNRWNINLTSTTNNIGGGDVYLITATDVSGEYKNMSDRGGTYNIVADRYKLYGDDTAWPNGAHWQFYQVFNKVITVTEDVNGGNYGVNNAGTYWYDLIENKEVNLIAEPIENYIFNGWISDGEGTIIPDSDVSPFKVSAVGLTSKENVIYTPVFTFIDGIADQKYNNSIYGSNGKIVFEGINDTVKIYNTAGIKIRETAINGSTYIEVPKGIYFVTANGNSYKVTVK